jgi:hypothetical protein
MQLSLFRAGDAAKSGRNETPAGTVRHGGRSRFQRRGCKSGDVLWRHDLGQVVTWELDGGTIIGYHDFGHVDPVCQVQPV